MDSQIFLDPLPVVLVITDLLAVTANRQQALQLLHLTERRLKIV
jgi:hypothetical protein